MIGSLIGRVLSGYGSPIIGYKLTALVELCYVIFFA